MHQPINNVKFNSLGVSGIFKIQNGFHLGKVSIELFAITLPFLGRFFRNLICHDVQRLTCLVGQN